MVALGFRIKQLRLRAGLSKAALARRVGVSDVTISYWESGTIKQIGHERLQALAESLKCSLGDLLDDSPSSSPSLLPSSSPQYGILDLKANKPAPWLRQDAAVARFFSNHLLIPVANDCFLITPAKGEHFDFLAEGDLAAVLPLDSFDQDGIYLLEHLDRLMIRRLSSLEENEVTVMDESKQCETLSSHSFPYKLVGQVQACWRLDSFI